MRSALKEEAKKTIEELSLENVRVSLDFLQYLRDKEDIEATLEILTSKELMDQLEKAERAIQQGRFEDFLPWKKVRRNADLE